MFEPREGYDPATGMHRDTIRWAIGAVFGARPERVDVDGPLVFWLNALAGLANAYERSGGSLDDLREFERDGFHWTQTKGAKR